MKKWLGKRLWVWSILLVGLLAVGLGTYLYFAKAKERSYHLTITAGSVAGSRHELTELLRDELTPRGLLLDLRGSAGSEQSLDWVNSRQVDAALVQGGLEVDNRPNVRQVIALQIEPLHLLVKNELFEEAKENLSALQGRTVDFGPEGSGTHTLSVDVMEFAGLPIQGPNSPKGCIPKSLSNDQILAATSVQDLPDAIFVVSPLPAKAAAFLVTRHGFRLVPLPFGQAFALKLLARKEAEANVPQRQHIDKRRTFSTTIPAFTYSVNPPVPAADTPSLGNRLLLVAHKDVSPEAVLRLVDAILDSEFSKTLHPPLTTKQMELPPEFPWHAGSVRFIERNQPLVSGELMEHTQKVAAVLAAIASGLVVLWRWYTEYSRNRRSQAFRDFLNQVAVIEEQALTFERDRRADATIPPKLQQQLYQLKRKVLERYAEGELEGGEFMTTFLGQADHVSALLTRLMGYRV